MSGDYSKGLDGGGGAGWAPTGSRLSGRGRPESAASTPPTAAPSVRRGHAEAGPGRWRRARTAMGQGRTVVGDGPVGLRRTPPACIPRPEVPRAPTPHSSPRKREGRGGSTETRASPTHSALEVVRTPMLEGCDPSENSEDP